MSGPVVSAAPRGPLRQVPGATFAVAGAGLALLGVFALTGPTSLPGAMAIGIVLLCAAAPFAVRLAPIAPAILSMAVFVPQIAPAVWIFDPVAIGFIALGGWALARSGDRSAWDIGPAQWFAVASLAIPLLALPLTVVSVPAFLAGYKVIAVEVGFFLSLGYVVNRERIDSLLWAFPLSGIFVAGQLAWKMRGLGVLRLSRLDMRNFNSDLGWGASNYIAAVFTLCILGSLLLFIRERRLSVRILLVAAVALMMKESLPLYSRGAELALAIAVVVLIIGLGRLRALLVLLVAGAGGGLLLASTFGKVFLQRLTDPQEFLSWGARIQIWRDMWARFLAHPLTGIGLRQGHWQLDASATEGAHNIVLEFLNQQGILGGILIVTMIVAMYRLAARPRLVPDPNAREIRAGAFALLTAVLVNAMIEPTLSEFTYCMLFLYFVVWLRSGAAPPQASPADG